MGITGLLPFVQKSSRRANIREYSGCTVAIDAYCWLHKGAFACAEKLVMNEPTTQYVSYCMKFINMLLSHNIKPILVFDGQNLPAKAGTEQKRRQNRDVNRRKGMELLRAGRVSEGRNILRRALDVTHLMALEVMKECRRRNVDCIVAPYEADAQLAFFSLQNIAHVIITEDSDLLLFGCKTVMFKMDVNGNGVVVEHSKLHLSMGIRQDLFSLKKFRLMGILSGCDYIDSLPGIGLNKACKFVTRVSETDIFKCLEKLPCNLNMWSLEVTEEYRRAVVEAERTFRCQLVYDPRTRKQMPLTPPEVGEEVVGEIKDSATALQLALGNLNPKDLQRVDNFDPAEQNASKNHSVNAHRAPHPSIWSSNYDRPPMPKQPPPTITRHITAGRVIKVDVNLIPATKRDLKEIEVDNEVNDEDAEAGDLELLSLYQVRNKKSKSDGPLQVSRYFSPESAKEDSSNLSVLNLLDKSEVRSTDESFVTSPKTEIFHKSASLDEIDIFDAIAIDEHKKMENPEQCSQDSTKENESSDSYLADSGFSSAPSGTERDLQTSPLSSRGSLKHSSDSALKTIDLSSDTDEKLFAGSPNLKAFRASIGNCSNPKRVENKFDSVGAKKSVYFGSVTKNVVGKARASGLSKKKSATPDPKQSSLARFGFEILSKSKGNNAPV